MRAAIYHGSGLPVTVETIPDPAPAADELVVEVARCGICGSDISMTAGTPFDFQPGCFGHEFSGTVVALGSGANGWTIGDRVACMPKAGCGQCEACREGRLLFCPHGKSAAFGFAEYIALPASVAVPLPDNLSHADGALVEPMACGLRALKSGGMQPGRRVLVLGAGAMALSVIWWARRMGAASIVVASRSSYRCDVCLAFGADAVHAFDEDEPGSLTHALGGQPHIVVECVGKSGMINLAIEHVRLGGSVVSMGMCTRPEPLLPIAMTYKEAQLSFPLAYSIEEYRTTLHAIAESGFRPDSMISDVLPLDDLPAMLETLRAGAKMLKVHIDPRAGFARDRLITTSADPALPDQLSDPAQARATERLRRL